MFFGPFELFVCLLFCFALESRWVGGGAFEVWSGSGDWSGGCEMNREGKIEGKSMAERSSLR